ncbi:MAG: spore coat protein [Cellulosilyticaceae bacterium]
MAGFGEKEILTDALDSEKSATCLYNTFANECVHPDLRDTLLNILDQEHDIQFDVFNAMHARGYYPTPAAEQQKIAEAKQMHAAQADQ